MTVKQYDRQRKTKAEYLANVKIDYQHTRMLTLTSNKFLNYNKYQSEVKKFIMSLKYEYGKIEYIYGIECNSDFNHYHTHLIVIFDCLAPTLNLD